MEPHNLLELWEDPCSTTLFFRQLFDAASLPYTYVVGDPQSLHAVIIDTLRAALPRSRAGGGTRAEAARRAPHALPVIPVCDAGMRSGQATVILRDGGFPRVANLHGGMHLWQQMGLPVPRSTGPLPK